MSQSFQPPTLISSLTKPLNELHTEDGLREPLHPHAFGLVTPLTTTSSISTAYSSGRETSLSQEPIQLPSSFMPPAVLPSFSVQTQGLRNGFRLPSLRPFLADEKDEDENDEVASAFDGHLHKQWPTLGSPGSPPLSGFTTLPSDSDNLGIPERPQTFTCSYFFATTEGGIEQTTEVIAAAMKITHARLAAVAPPGRRGDVRTGKSGGGGPSGSRVSPMRVCQSTILALAPISFPRDDESGSVSLALHLPSLTLMTVKIVPTTDGCIKGEVEYIRAWAERTVLNDAPDAASAPTLQFYGAFPSVKHNAIVFAFEYMHRGSLANSLQQEGMAEAVASEGFINGLAFSLLSGLRTLSDEGYTHGDIKPSNILVAPAGFCIADYGSLRIQDPYDIPTSRVPSARRGSDVPFRASSRRGSETLHPSIGHARRLSWWDRADANTASPITSTLIAESPMPPIQTPPPAPKRVEPIISPFARAYRTEAFSSPERKQGKNFGHLADVWSVGVILSGASKGIKFRDMAGMPEAEDAWTDTKSCSSLSPQLTDLIAQAVTHEESERPFGEELLEHPALAHLDAATKVAATADASAIFKVTKERVSAQLEVIALTLRALKTIGRHIDIETLSINVARQMETPIDFVRARLMKEGTTAADDVCNTNNT